MLNKKILTIISIFLVILILSFSTLSYAYIWSENDEIVETTATVSEDTLNLESEAAILIDQTTGEILYEHNSHEQLRPASVTKVMTILLIMEALDNGEIKLDDKISCSEKASSMGGSQIWLDTRETLTVNEMLKAICVVSANDCTVAMAEHLAGTEEAFVERMNKRAKELGMNDTTFKNCHGIDEDGHITSAYDISLMSRELLEKHPSITNYTTIYMDTLRDGKSELVNTNKLVRNYQGCTGLKTGSTSLALFNLSASATRDGLSLIAVIMRAPTTATRFSEAQRLLNYGFSNYASASFGEKGDIVKKVTVEKGVEPTVNAVLNSKASVLIKKGQEKSVTQTITMDEKITAPIEKGQKIGEATYTLNDETIAKIDIIAEKEIKKLTLWNVTTNLFSKWYNLCRDN